MMVASTSSSSAQAASSSSEAAASTSSSLSRLMKSNSGPHSIPTDDLLVIDVETTDLPERVRAKSGQPTIWNQFHPYTNSSAYKKAHILELACILYDKDGNEKEAFSSIIQPSGFVIDPNSPATKKHHITQEQALGK